MTRSARPSRRHPAEALQARRAALAAGVAPLLVLAVFTAVVCGFIDADTAAAWFAACTVWVVCEMLGCPDDADAGDRRDGPAGPPY